MTNIDDEPGLGGEAEPPNAKRRRLIVAGVASLAVVLGAGAYVFANRGGDTVTQDTTAVAPIAPPALSEASAETSPSPPKTPSTSVATSSSSSSTSSTSPSAATSLVASKKTDGSSVRKKIEEARERAARDGHPIQRALTGPPLGVHAAESRTELNRPLANGNGAMRIISARGDLSGESEMLWAGDGGEPSGGGVSCTQRFRFAQNAAVAARPTMLLCWKLSDSRSVVVLAVAKKGSPSRQESVAALAQQWDKLA